MIVGFPPFYSKQPSKIYELVRTKEVLFPDPERHYIYMSDSCKHFISACLRKDPGVRLGTNNDVKEILSHPWFADLFSDQMMSKSYKPEFIPQLPADPMDDFNQEQLEFLHTFSEK